MGYCEADDVTFFILWALLICIQLLMNFKLLITFGTILILSSCSKQEKIYNYSSPVYKNLVDIGQQAKEQNYLEFKKRQQHKQQLFYEEYHRSGAQHRKDLIALSQKYVYKTMVDTIFPFWYDTPWDYNGITQTPGKGKIACGYFVTTTLRDMGFKLERARLAQQASANIIKSVCGEGKTKVIGHNDMDALETYLLSQKDGLFIMGLDNHIGFIHKQGELLYAIHSNGVSGSMKVVKEPIRTCKLMLKSKAYYIAALTANSNTHAKWVRKEKIATVK